MDAQLKKYQGISRRFMRAITKTAASAQRA